MTYLSLSAQAAEYHAAGEAVWLRVEAAFPRSVASYMVHWPMTDEAQAACIAARSLIAEADAILVHEDRINLLTQFQVRE